MSTLYEKFVQEIYQSLLNQDDNIQNIVAQHNTKLIGKSGASHQIDVYWEFKIADTIYRTCIECRSYESSIKKHQIAAFKAILDDIGNANGIMVTTQGFQEGALTYANHHGVRLLLINPALQKIVVNFSSVSPRIENIKFDFDTKSYKSVLESANVESVDIPIRVCDQDNYLYDKDGNQTRKLLDVLLSSIGKAGQYLLPLNDEYWRTEYGLIKLNSISFELQEVMNKEQMSVSEENIARTVIEDVLENTRKYIFNDGSVSSHSRRDE